MDRPPQPIRPLDVVLWQTVGVLIGGMAGVTATLLLVAFDNPGGLAGYSGAGTPVLAVLGGLAGTLWGTRSRED